MGRNENVHDNFNHRVPGAADKNMVFLEAVLSASEDAGIGFPLKWVKKRKVSPYLQGSVTFGNIMTGKRPYFLQVHAEPQGRDLSVGFQLTTNEVGGFLAGTNAGAQASRTQARIHNKPETQRKLDAIVTSFSECAFIPVLEQFVEKFGAPESSTRRNFF